MITSTVSLWPGPVAPVPWPKVTPTDRGWILEWTSKQGTYKGLSPCLPALSLAGNELVLAMETKILWGFLALSIQLEITPFIFLRKYVNFHYSIQLHIYFIMYRCVDFFFPLNHTLTEELCDLVLCRIKILQWEYNIELY